jgi:hypothetical protein
MSDEKQVDTRISEDFDMPNFKASIPDYMLDGMDKHNKFLLEQITIMKQQNEWQSDVVYKIYDYTKTINGKVIELEHFRQRLSMELELDQKWSDREKEVTKYKKYAAVIFLGILYPLYLTVVNSTGIGQFLESLLKFNIN